MSNFENFVDLGYCYKVGGKKPHPVYSDEGYMCNKTVVEHFYDIYFVIGGNKVKLKKGIYFYVNQMKSFVYLMFYTGRKIIC